MATKKILGLCLLLGAVFVAAAGGYYLHVKSAREEPKFCDVCRRPIMPATAFTVVADRHAVWYCCPRCWVTSEHASPGHFDHAVATDYVSGRMVEAEKCLYVEGSEVMPCCGPDMTRGMDGMPAAACFDRCYPSVIAFAVPQEAAAFAAAHGGNIISLQTLMNEAKQP